MLDQGAMCYIVKLSQSSATQDTTFYAPTEASIRRVGSLAVGAHVEIQAEDLCWHRGVIQSNVERIFAERYQSHGELQQSGQAVEEPVRTLPSP